MASSEFWMDVIDSGNNRFPEEFKGAEYSNDAWKLGVALTHEWKPEPLRVDLILRDNSNTPEVKLLEVPGADFECKRRLMKYAQGNAQFLLGPAMKSIHGTYKLKSPTGPKMNSLTIVGPEIPSAHLIRKDEAIAWLLDGFEVFHVYMTQKLLVEFGRFLPLEE